MFDNEVSTELAYLRDAGKVLAQRHPETFGALAAPSTRPELERLLQGFSLLSARIHQRANDALPEALEQLAELIAPHTLRPIPAMTIMECAPLPAVLRERTILRAGSLFGARNHQGVMCTFSSSWDVPILPITLESTKLDEHASLAPSLRLSLRIPEHARNAFFSAEPLRLFLSASWPLASMLRHWMTRHLVRCELVSPLGRADLPLPQASQDDERLFAWPETITDTTPALVESLVLPQRHLFFDVRGLERIDRALQSERVEIILQYERPPALPERLPQDAFRLFCVPAVNVFPTNTEPLRYDPLRPRQLLRAQGHAQDTSEIFSVEEVVGLRAAQGRTRYSPATRGALGARAEGTYTLHRTRSLHDGRMDTFLDVHVPDAKRGETLSVSVLATNRHAATSLRVGDVALRLDGSPASVSFRNITHVTAPATPALGEELHWHLVGHLAAQHRSIASLEGLTALLESALRSLPFDGPSGAAHQRRVAGIRGVASTPSVRSRQGMVARGITTEITLDESHFQGMGDLAFFAHCLDRLLSAEVPLNTFHALQVHVVPSKRELTFAPRFGSGALL
jgi:type VI secretion system protein ImpG